MAYRLLGWVFVIGFVTISGCSDGGGSSPAAPTLAVSPAEAEVAAVKATDVVNIVFVGQKKACDCTRTRVDNSWKALESTLAGRKDIAVERIALDVDEARADQLDKLQSLMVAPGIYFFDKNEQLLEMLQGEVTPAQIIKAL